ncbi:hypothetical protein ACVW00_001052 [Marmoricola sp. URHA0025 HA25]
MKGIPVVLADLHEAEVHLHLELQRLGERHGADHEDAHVTRDLAAWSAAHVQRLASEGRRFDLELGDVPRSTNPLAAGVRRKSSELMGRRHAPAVLLVNDLRQVYGDACLVHLDWVLLGQLAQATRDSALLDLAGSCGAESERQVHWAESKLKDSVVQAMTIP